MGKMDVLLKSYLGDARRYADLWNGGLFCGRQIVKAEELEEIPPILVHANQKEVLEKQRDLVMKQNGAGQRFAVFVVENQKTVDYRMPARVMLEEILEYSRQIKRIMKGNAIADKMYKKGQGASVYRNEGERLYQFKESDRICPVVTLVVYWGERGWTGPRNLHEMIDFGKSEALAAELKKLIPAYPLHFMDLSKFKHFEYFKTELSPFLELYSKRNNKQEFIEYVANNKRCRRMDEESWHVFSQITHSSHLKNILKNNGKKWNGGEGMCKAMDEWYDDAIAEGKEKGKIEGKIEAKIEAIYELLEEYGEVPKNLKELIDSQKNMEILTKWHKLAARLDGMDAFYDAITQ